MRKWRVVFAGLALAMLAPAMGQVRMMQVPQAARPTVPSQTTDIDYQTQYRQEVEKNKALRSENASLKAQLDSFTSRTGSRVTAYCETPTLSRNTAGASNDCSRSGFGCEPVTGLCRTVAHSTDECAAGFVWCSRNNACVRTPQECGG